MLANKSTFYIGAVEVYMDFIPTYGTWVNYIREWVTKLCHRKVELVLYDKEEVAPDLLTIKDQNITANFIVDRWHHNSETFSKVGMFYPFETSSLFIFSKNPIKVEKNSFHNFLPIQGNVYLSLLGLMALVSYILVSTNNKIKGVVNVIKSQTSELANMAAIIIRQGEISSSRSPSYKVLFGVWLLGAFLFSTLTQTYLKCEFANVKYIPMDSVADVADNLDVVEIMVFGNIFIESFLSTSLDPKARVIWRHLKEKDQVLYMKNLGDALGKINNAKHWAFFITKSTLLLVGTDLLGLSESDRVHEGPPIFSGNFGFIHSPDISPACKEHINRKQAIIAILVITGFLIIIIIFAYRLIKLQEMKWIESETKEAVFKLDRYTFRPTLEQDSESVLSFGEAKSTFALLIIGYVASTVTYFTVHAIFASRNDHQKRCKVRQLRRPILEE